MPKQKKLFDPDGGEDVWKHDRFELLDLPPEEDDYRVWLRPLLRQPVCVWQFLVIRTQHTAIAL